MMNVVVTTCVISNLLLLTFNIFEDLVAWPVNEAKQTHFRPEYLCVVIRVGQLMVPFLYEVFYCGGYLPNNSTKCYIL